MTLPDYWHQVGSAISWTITLDGSQPVNAVLKFRYANGSSGKKKSMAMTLTVNGAAPSTLDFPGTRSTQTNDMHGLGAFILMFEQMNR